MRAGGFLTALVLAPPVPAPSADEGWTAFAVFAAWLVLVPSLRYLVARLSGARLRKETFRFTPYPVLFPLFRTIGHRFGRGAFVLACAVPSLVA